MRKKYLKVENIKFDKRKGKKYFQIIFEIEFRVEGKGRLSH